MTAHSSIGASSMYRWSACPGSVRLSAGIQSRSSAYAEEGTEAHDWAAKILLDRKTWFAAPEDMREPLAVYVDYVDSIPGRRLVEHKFDLSSVYPGCFGTADAVVYDAYARTLHVIDLKFGAGIPVEVVYKDGTLNPQLCYYALGALMTLPEFKPERVTMTIVQPRCEHPDGPIRSHTIPVVDLLDFRGDLITYAKRTEEPNAELVPGDHCRFCPVAGVPGRCAALESQVRATARLEFSAAVGDGAPVSGTTLGTGALPTVAAGLPYNPEDLKRALDSRPVLQAWLKRLDEFAYGEAENGRNIPGYKLVEKRANRKYRSEGEVLEALQEANVPQDKYLEPGKLKSPAQLEKSLGKTFPVDQFTVRESSGHVLVPESDKRPAVKISAAAEFTD